jgi:molybdopterin converting factor small subunit
VRITLTTFGMLEAMIKEREFSLPDGIRMGEFINTLAERCGPEIREHLLPGGAFNAHYFIFVNGRNIKRLQEMETELSDGDAVFITTLVDGG